MSATVTRIGGEAAPAKVSVTTPLSAKEALAQAFEQLGSVGALIEWIGDDEDRKKIFYTQLWPKLLGAEAKEAGREHVVVEEIRETIVDPRTADGPGL